MVNRRQFLKSIAMGSVALAGCRATNQPVEQTPVPSTATPLPTAAVRPSATTPEPTVTSAFTPEPNPVPITAISAGGSICLALDDDGYVWVWGNGTSVGKGPENVLRPTNLDIQDVVGMDSGTGDTSVFVKADGTVHYVHESGGDTIRPIPGLENIVQAVCEDQVVSCIDADGQLWMWREEGMTFYPSQDEFDPLPTGVFRLASDVRFKHVEFTFLSLLAIDEDNRLWALGKPDMATRYEPILPTLQIYPGVSNIIDVDMGFNLTAVRQDGTLWQADTSAYFTQPFNLTGHWFWRQWL